MMPTIAAVVSAILAFIALEGFVGFTPAFFFTSAYFWGLATIIEAVDS